MKPDKFFRNLLTVILILISSIILYRARTLMTPVLTALIVAYIFYPLILAGSKIGVPKGISILIIVLVILSSVSYAGYRGIPAIKDEIILLMTTSSPKKDSKLISIYKNLSNQLIEYGLIAAMQEPQELIDMAQDWFNEQSTMLLQTLGGAATKTGQFFMIFFFVLVFSLKDGEKFYQFLTRLLPNSFFEPGLYMLKKTNDLFGYYLRGLVIENTILGIIAFILLLIVKVFAPLTVGLCLIIALLIAFTNVIRFLGPFIGGAVGLLLVLIYNANFMTMMGVLGVVIIVQLLDNVLVLPLVMQDQVDVHPVLCLLSVIAGGIIGGILGMMLAIPIVGAIKVIFRIQTVEMKIFNMDPEEI